MVITLSIQHMILTLSIDNNSFNRIYVIIPYIQHMVMILLNQIWKYFLCHARGWGLVYNVVDLSSLFVVDDRFIHYVMDHSDGVFMFPMWSVVEFMSLFPDQSHQILYSLFPGQTAMNSVGSNDSTLSRNAGKQFAV